MKYKIEFVLSPKHSESILHEIDARILPVSEYMNNVAKHGVWHDRTMWFPPHRIKEVIITEVNE